LSLATFFGRCRQLAWLAEFSKNRKVPSSNPLAIFFKKLAAISEPTLGKKIIYFFHSQGENSTFLTL